MAVRLNKYLADRGIGARRKCDDLIAQGRVSVNGHIVTEAGTKVEDSGDRVSVDGKPVGGRAQHVYYIINKPVGVITTLDDPQGRRTIREFLPRGARLYPVGRLDADTSGLLLLTNDGDLAHKLMHPRYGVQKVYRVRLAEEPRGDQLRRLAVGVRFDKGLVSGPARVRRIDPGFDAIMIELIIHEGRFRQVRKMCEAVGLVVTGLHRVGYGPLRMGPLARGMFRELSEEEVAQLRAAGSRPGGLLRGESAPVRKDTEVRPAAAVPARTKSAVAPPERIKRTAALRRPKAVEAPPPVDDDDDVDELEETWLPGGGVLAPRGADHAEDGWPVDEAPSARGPGRDLDDDDTDDGEERDSARDDAPVAEWPARASKRRGDAAWIAEQPSGARPAPARARSERPSADRPRAAGAARPAPRGRANAERPAARAAVAPRGRGDDARPLRGGFGSRLDRPKRDPFAPHSSRAARAERAPSAPRAGRPERAGFASRDERPARGGPASRAGRPERGGFASRDERPARGGPAPRAGRPERGGFASRDERPARGGPAPRGGRPLAEPFGPRKGRAPKPDRPGFNPRGGQSSGVDAAPRGARPGARPGSRPSGRSGAFGAAGDERPARRGSARPGAPGQRSFQRSDRPGASPGARPSRRPGARTGPRPSGKPKRGMGDFTQSSAERGRGRPAGRPGRPAARGPARGGAAGRSPAGRKYAGRKSR